MVLYDFTEDTSTRPFGLTWDAIWWCEQRELPWELHIKFDVTLLTTTTLLADPAMTAVQNLVKKAESAESNFEPCSYLFLLPPYPIVDMHDIRASFVEIWTDPVVRRALANKIRDVCINVGFFYGDQHPFRSYFPQLISFLSVKNHGISESTIQNALESSQHFFCPQWKPRGST